MEKERDSLGRFKPTGLPRKKRVRTEYNREYHKKTLADPEKHAKRLEGSRKSWKKHQKARQKNNLDWSHENRERSMAIKKKHFVSKRERLAARPIPEQCEICGSFDKEMKKSLCYDHCHTTGEFRGWICSRCNLALGLVKDNKETLQAMINYLKPTE